MKNYILQPYSQISTVAPVLACLFSGASRHIPRSAVWAINRPYRQSHWPLPWIQPWYVGILIAWTSCETWNIQHFFSMFQITFRKQKKKQICNIHHHFCWKKTLDGIFQYCKQGSAHSTSRASTSSSVTIEAFRCDGAQPLRDKNLENEPIWRKWFNMFQLFRLFVENSKLLYEQASCASRISCSFKVNQGITQGSARDATTFLAVSTRKFNCCLEPHFSMHLESASC